MLFYRMYNCAASSLFFLSLSNRRPNKHHKKKPFSQPTTFNRKEKGKTFLETASLIIRIPRISINRLQMTSSSSLPSSSTLLRNDYKSSSQLTSLPPPITHGPICTQKRRKRGGMKESLWQRMCAGDGALSGARDMIIGAIYKRIPPCVYGLSLRERERKREHRPGSLSATQRQRRSIEGRTQRACV